ncbi:ECF RNA polymerase sigma factor SigK [Yinghuangia sp. YIM S09857]|uniref:ECF RNA polymerase sigma factor SigK n=1 Tax=Yinghuangia sp. YIM S09857 TaxID=3436929 RepID=UPI003F53B6ED
MNAMRPASGSSALPPHAGPLLDERLRATACGDEGAFAEVYDVVAGPVYRLVRGVVRDPAQSEEVAQEVMLELWRTAARFDPAKGSAWTWALTLAHRRAVDRVRAEEAERHRRDRAAAQGTARPYDDVVEQVEANFEQRQVRRCLHGLTELQRESVTLAYYGGLTYREVAERLALPLGTVKTRLRDALIRLRDCLGVSAL